LSIQAFFGDGFAEGNDHRLIQIAFIVSIKTKNALFDFFREIFSSFFFSGNNENEISGNG
jgi:hypothetical protein